MFLSLPCLPISAASSDAYMRRLRETGQAGNPNKAPEGTNRSLYDSHSSSLDIMSQQQKAAWNEAVTSAPGGLRRITAVNRGFPLHLLTASRIAPPILFSYDLHLVCSQQLS